MQGFADGYFVLPVMIGNYFGNEGVDIKRVDVTNDHDVAREARASVDQRIDKIMSIKGDRSPDSFHRALGKICWDNCGMARSREGLSSAIEEIKALREEFWQNLKILGDRDTLNQSLEKAGRVADFLEFGELMVRDALHREESCGGHFRVEHQTPEGEAKRNDEDFTYVAAWEFQGAEAEPTLHKEQLEFEYVKLTQRSYK
jgi:succinate dehydrogenase / fumarate reductase flavoprotein subunit